MQGADIQANSPDNMQVDEGCVADPDSEGIISTRHLPDGSSLQSVVPGSVPEGSSIVPPGVPFNLGGYPQNRLGVFPSPC